MKGRRVLFAPPFDLSLNDKIFQNLRCHIIKKTNIATLTCI